MVKIGVLTHLYSYRTCYDFVAFVICNGSLVGWLIYGYVIFYSDANNCDKVPDTAFLNSLMFVILFVGYMIMFIYLMLLCTLPCVYSMIRESNQPGRRAGAGAAGASSSLMANAQIPGILASLSRT